MLYVGCVYGFWSNRFIRERGGRKTIKAGTAADCMCHARFTYHCCQDWAELQGTRLRCIASHFVKNLVRTPHARRVSAVMHCASKDHLLTLLKDPGSHGFEEAVLQSFWAYAAAWQQLLNRVSAGCGLNMSSMSWNVLMLRLAVVVVCWEAVEDMDGGDEVFCVESGDEEAIFLSVWLLCSASKLG